MEIWSHETHRALAALEPLMWAAGDEVLRRWRGRLEISYKDGDPSSPVTDADRRANEILVAGLAAAFPGDAVLAEESADDLGRRATRRLWCVDPIDGTREFIAQSGDFAVMVGLAVDGAAVLGALLQPSTGLLLAGAEGTAMGKEGRDGRWQPRRAARRPAGEATVAVSRAHPPQRLLATLAAAGITKVLPRGSIGLKMAAVATGEADVYITTSGAMQEWDTCAPEAICRAAGGSVSDLAGAPLAYNKAQPNTPAGLAACNPSLHAEVLAALAPLARARGLIAAT